MPELGSQGPSPFVHRGKRAQRLGSSSRVTARKWPARFQIPVCLILETSVLFWREGVQRTVAFPGMGRRVKKPLSQRKLAQISGPGVLHLAQQRDSRGKRPAHTVTPHAPTQRRKGGPEQGRASWQQTAPLRRGTQGPPRPPPQTHSGEVLARAASFPCSSKRRRTACPKLLTTEADRRDGWTEQAQQGADFTQARAHSPTHLGGGRGCRTSLAGLGCPPSLGSRPKPPKSPSQAGKGLTPTLLSQGN